MLFCFNISYSSGLKVPFSAMDSKSFVEETKILSGMKPSGFPGEEDFKVDASRA